MVHRRPSSICRTPGSFASPCRFPSSLPARSTNPSCRHHHLHPTHRRPRLGLGSWPLFPHRSGLDQPPRSRRGRSRSFRHPFLRTSPTRTSRPTSLSRALLLPPATSPSHSPSPLTWGCCQMSPFFLESDLGLLSSAR